MFEQMISDGSNDNIKKARNNEIHEKEFYKQ
jgi:hypothetical protein